MFSGFKKRLQVRRARQAVAQLLRSRPELKLEIGSGPVKGKQGWTTLDRSDQADLNWDLAEALPFPDNSVDFIYSSHVLEHFFYPELLRLVRECRRILKPQGVFSACVPDASIYIRGYLEYEQFDRAKYLTYPRALNSGTRMDILNYIAYMDGHHRYMFDKVNLVELLSRAGFAAVRLREFDPALDLQHRDYESIYAVGIKPEPDGGE